MALLLLVVCFGCLFDWLFWLGCVVLFLRLSVVIFVGFNCTFGVFVVDVRLLFGWFNGGFLLLAFVAGVCFVVLLFCLFDLWLF